MEVYEARRRRGPQGRGHDARRAAGVVRDAARCAAVLAVVLLACSAESLADLFCDAVPGWVALLVGGGGTVLGFWALWRVACEEVPRW